MIGLGRPSHSKATRHPRQSSAAFLEVFDANQLATMRELFHFLDQDSDGCITKQDLLAVFQSFGASRIRTSYDKTEIRGC